MNRTGMVRIIERSTVKNTGNFDKLFRIVGKGPHRTDTLIQLFITHVLGLQWHPAIAYNLQGYADKYTCIYLINN